MKAVPVIGGSPRQIQESDTIAACLARKVNAGADARQVAETIAAACLAIDSALSPIIGSRGVAALFKRSVHLAQPSHSWLEVAHSKALTPMDFAALTSLLAQQTGADAAAAGALVLQTFHDLLANLVGPPLTERLLRPAWAILLSGPSALDTSP